jgi:hypothetical protein
MPRVLAGLLLVVTACAADKRANNGPGLGGFNNPAAIDSTKGHASGGGPGSNGSPDTNIHAPCDTPGATRQCCQTGEQTCTGEGVEFSSWGPCTDPRGKTLTCSGPCALSEFAVCDAGVDKGIDGGTNCWSTEFSVCDGGTPPPPSLCSNKTINNEPEILAAYSPANGASVPQNGQIKVWINDEGAAIIAPNEQIDPTTGAITAPGDRTAKAPDGYLWEPALYIAPQTAESGGKPHFPQWIKGWYNNNPATATAMKPPAGSAAVGVQISGMDPPPAGTPVLREKYTSEDIWDVRALGLAPGTYHAEFVIHDGDRDRAVGCVTIAIKPAE